MSKLKTKKTFALLGIFTLLFFIVAIILISKYDRFKGLIKLDNVNIKLLSNVYDATNINGTDEVTYQVRYTLDQIEGVSKRDVLIKGELNSKYARFKNISSTDYSSTIENDGKTIYITVKDVPLGEEQIVNLKINVVEAPNNEEIKPDIKIKEKTGEYTNLNTDTLHVVTNSIEGTCLDENNFEASNIELSLKKDGTEIKRTYTDSEGKFVFSNLEEGNYTVNVEEDIYELINDSSSVENNTNLLLSIKKVDKFNIETHKYITNLKLVVDGKEKNYSYDDAEKVVQNIKKFGNISGEITYKIVVQNNSTKETELREVIDELQDGLTFSNINNTGWVEEDNKVRYIPLEGVLLKPFEKREASITLNIANTNSLKTYVNKLTTRGEINEKVVFILDGKEIKNINVLEGQKVDKPSIDVTWYIDRNKTKEYDFDREVTKDLILYASSEETKYKVTFIDNNQVINVSEVLENEKVSMISDPVRDGYTFKCWTLDDVCFDFDSKIESDITLISDYKLNTYSISYDGLTEDEEDSLDNPISYNIETETFRLNNPDTRKDNKGNNYQDFVGWNDGKGNVSLNVDIPKGSTGNKTYIAVWVENNDSYSINYDLDGGEYELGKTNPNSYTRQTETFRLNNPNKVGYTFEGWSGTDLTALSKNVSIIKGSAGKRNYTANYLPIDYTITYNGLTDEEINDLKNPTSFNIESNLIEITNPSRTGYTFEGWSGTGINGKTLSLSIPTGSIDDRTYTANFKINKYKVTYMDGDNKFYEEEVNYNSNALGTEDIPTRTHQVFLGWYLNNDLFDYGTQITENITLYSRYETVETPSISYSPNTWTKENITVSISSSHEDYTYMYKIDNGSYQLYTEPFVIDGNNYVYAYSIKNNIASLEVSENINNMDKILPVINNMSLNEITPISAVLDLSIIDEQSGLDKYRVYVNNELVFESLSYLNHLNEERIEEYQIYNLDELTTYLVKLEVIDKVGNINTRELELETPSKHYVARILNYQNEEIVKYETLKEAIESNECASSCHIQMLDSVEERNTIASSQNIKIDLNGKVISSNNYTFTNNGSLTIVDYSDQNDIGTVIGSVAIKNNNILQVGENESDLFVSDVRPIISGSTYGIESSGTLKFFDGLIIADNPVNGLIDETPYLYNANIVLGSNETLVARLDKVVNAVARINSIYYTEAQSAIDETPNGYEEEVDYTRPLVEQLRSTTDERFIIDEETGVAINSNRKLNSSLAYSYIKIDLTNYNDNQFLKVNIESSMGTGDHGYLKITESSDMPDFTTSDDRMFDITGVKAATTYDKILLKGKIYYLHFGCKKDGTSSNDKDGLFKINSITLGNFDAIEFSEIGDIKRYKNSTYYFSSQSDGSFVSNNNGVANSTAHTYFIVDLTNVDENKYILVNAKVSSQSGSDYGYIVVDNGWSIPSTSAEGRQVYISGETEGTYTVELKKNQLNFIHFCYYKNANTNTGDDNFIIKSIKPVLYENYSIEENIINNGTYYFEKQEDGSFISNNKGIHNSTANSYILYDLTDHPTDVILNIKYTISSQSNNDYGYITLTNNSTAPAYNDTTGRKILVSGNTYTSSYRVRLSGGQLNYLHFGYRKSGSTNSNDDSFIINSLNIFYPDEPYTLDYIDFLKTVTEDYSDSEKIPVLNQEPETVVLIRDVTLTDSLEIVNTRDVILDLNGKTLTTASDDYVIKNKGKLKIIDTDAEYRRKTNIDYQTEQARLFEQAKIDYITDLAEYEEYMGLCGGCEPSEEYLFDQSLSKSIDYSGTSYEYTASYDGPYKLEVWGAQGGGLSLSGNTNSGDGGKGGYSTGNIELTSGEKLYVYVGGQGLSAGSGKASGGYNGGGAAWGSSTGEPANGGGGATDIRIEGTSLYNRIIVAGGGGGGGDDANENGGVGGGLTGTSTYPGTQTGTSNGGAFGKGANTNRDGGAGGGGWYGGGTLGGTQNTPTSNSSSDTNSSASGGSGFVYTDSSTAPVSGYLVSSHILTDAYTIDGNSDTIPTYDGTSTMTGNSGNGFAKITYLGFTEEQIEELRNNMEPTYKVKERPVFKNYLSDIDFDESVDVENLTLDSNPTYQIVYDAEVVGNIRSSTESVVLNDYGAYLDFSEGIISLYITGAYNGITNKGTLTMGEKAYINALKDENRGIYNAASGDILDGAGTITTSGSSSIGLLNYSINDSNIKGYNIDSKGAGILNYSYNNLFLDDFNIKSYSTSIYLYNDTDLEVKNSTLTTSNSDVFINSTSSGENSITFNNCNINGRILNSEDSNSKIYILNSYINSNNKTTAIYNYNGEIYVENTDFYNSANGANSTTTYYPTIYNRNKLDINGGSITKKSSDYSFYGIYNASGATATVTGDLTISNNYKNGIYNLGTVTLGNDDDTVSTTYPLIQGSTSGIYNTSSAKFYYYDGKLVGATKYALDGMVDKLPSDYDLDITQSANAEVVTLKSDKIALSDEDYIAAIGNNKFMSIQAAIDFANENTPTEIRILKDIYTGKNNIIPDNKNILLNQNNHLIRTYNKTTGFTNNGTFTINNGENEIDYLNISIGPLIINNGTTNYNSSTYSFRDKDVIINKENATFNVNGGTLYSTETGIINNSGDLNFNSGYIYNSSGTASSFSLITNSSTGQIIINGGDFTTTGASLNIIDNSGSVIVNDAIVNISGLHATANIDFIKNSTTGSFASIKGGTYGNTAINGRIIQNKGTAEILNINSNLRYIASNSGNLTVRGGTFKTTNGYNDSVASGSILSTAGTLTVDDVKITESKSRPVITLTGSAVGTVSNCTFNKKIKQNDTSQLTLINTNITSSIYALELTGTGITDIVSGSLISTGASSAAIYISSGATLNIGTEGGDVSKVDPEITAAGTGIYNSVSSSKVNIYDGIITGKTAIYGGVTKLEEGYELILTTEGELEHKYLDMLPVVKNKRTGTEYDSIQEAVNYAENGDILEFVREYTTTPSADTIEIPSGKDITFDLMGFKIQQNQSVLFKNYGTMTIQSSLSDGIIETYSNNIFVNEGILNIESGIYKQTKNNYIITNNELATLNINGGEIRSTTMKAIYNYGIINISSGILYGVGNTSVNYNESSLIYNTSSGYINITGGNFNYSSNRAVIYNSGRVEANNPTVDLRGNTGGTYPSTTSFIYNSSDSSYASITNGTYGETNRYGSLIKGKGTAIISNLTSNFYDIASISGSLTIDTCSFNTSRSSSNGDIVSSGGNLTINKVTIHGSVNIPSVYISGSTIATITDSSFNTYISQNGTSKLTFTNSTISTNTDSLELTDQAEFSIISGTIKTSSSSKSAILMDSAVTLNIGQEGGEVSNENPKIIGGTYGINNSALNATVNFYDGIISGKTAIYGGVNEIENGYEIILNNVDDIEYKYLDMLPVVRNQRTGTEYESIQEAVNLAQSGDILEFIREYTTTPSADTIEIPSGKEITFDLKEYKIIQNQAVLFINNGTMNIESSSSSGSIETYNDNIFINNGILNIKSGIYKQKKNNFLITNNSGATLNITGGDILSSSYRIINNKGQMNISSGKLYGVGNINSTNNNLIYNTSSGIIDITGGEFVYSGRGAVIYNANIVDVRNPKVDLTGYYSPHSSSNYYETFFIHNYTASSNSYIKGGTYGETNNFGSLVKNAGTAVIEDTTSNLRYVANNTGNLTIENSTFNTLNYEGKRNGALISSDGTLTIDNMTINESNGYPAVYVAGSTNATIINSHFNKSIYETGSANVYIENCTSIASGNVIRVFGSGTVDIISGVYKSTGSNALYTEGTGTINIGVSGGIPSNNDPLIQGKNYGVYNYENNTNIYFYDGVLRGETAPVYGIITDYEPGYKEERISIVDSETGLDTIESTLTPIGSEHRVVIVNNINFPSIQSAVNYAVNNSISDLDLYKDIDLDADLIKPEGIDVNIYLNGYTINQNGYSISSGINLISGNNPNNLGASVYNNKTNKENIIIYQLNDGSILENDKVYRLYKFTSNDYELIKFNENQIGDYDIGRNTTELYTVSGKLYINNLSEGTYRLISSDGNRIDFEVLSNGVSSNIRINNKVKGNRVVESFATLILQLQTGKINIPYVAIIGSIFVIIIGMIIIKKKKIVN